MQSIKWIAAISFVIASSANADDIHLKNSRGIVPVNTHSGTTIEFARAIKEVDRSSHFQVTAIIKKVTKKSRRPVDIRSIHITPNSARSKDRITVRLAGGRQIVLRIVATSGADLNHRIHLRAKRKTKNAATIAKFLEPKIKLLKAMLSDSESLGFERVETDDSLEGLEAKFEMELVRKYIGSSLFGYVIEVENDTDQIQKVRSSWFSEFSGQKISLAHAGHEILASCGKHSKAKPCKTRLYLVTSDPNFDEKEKSFSKMPFSLEGGR